MTGSPPTRRAFLAALGATGVAGLAGCNGTVDRLAGGEDCPDYDPAETANTEWTTAMGDAAGTATVASGAAPGSELSLSWTFPIDTHVGYPVPAVADGSVYVHGMDTTLYAVDAGSGERRWSVEVTDPRSAPAVAGETVVVQTADGVEAFDAASGDRRWSALDVAPDLFASAPVVADGAVYSMLGVSVHALDLATGEVRWRVPTGLPSRSTPAVIDGTVYAAGDDTYVRALSTADGAERWRVKLDDPVRTNVSVAAGTVSTGAADGTVVAFDVADGSERWRHRLPHPTGGRQERPGTVNTDGSRVYVTTEEALRVLAADTGELCWTAREYRESYASGVAVADGRVYAPTEEGREDGFGTFDAATGDRLATWGSDRDYPPDFGPAIADGALYATGRGALCRFG